MKPVETTAPIFAETPHARTLNLFLQTGAIGREPYVELIIEDLNLIYGTSKPQREKTESCTRIAEHAARVMLKYLDQAPPEEAEKLMYWVHSVVERRLLRESA